MSTKKTIRLLTSPTNSVASGKLLKKSSTSLPVDLTTLPPPRQAVKRRRSPVASSVPNKSRSGPLLSPATDSIPISDGRNSGSVDSAVSFSSQGASPDASSLASSAAMASILGLSRFGHSPSVHDGQLKLLEDQSRLLYYYCNIGANSGTLLDPSISGINFARGKDSSSIHPSMILPTPVPTSDGSPVNPPLVTRSSSASGDSPGETITRQTSSISSSDELNDGDTPCKQRGRRNYKNMTRERRIEANARERTRVHTIGAAFETLRQTVPAYSNNQKLSKLAILRIACSYILSLSRLADLDYSADQSQPDFAECLNELTQTIQTEGKMRRN